jgi:hypothetical protein
MKIPKLAVTVVLILCGVAVAAGFWFLVGPSTAQTPAPQSTGQTPASRWNPPTPGPVNISQNVASRPTPQGTPPPLALQHLAPPKGSGPSGPPPPTRPGCGSWSGAQSTTGASIQAQHGPIRNCALIGTTWVIATLHDQAHDRGAILVYRCSPSDSACLDPQTDHPAAQWQTFPAPYPGDVTFLAGAQATGSPSRIIIDNGGHQLDFDLSADTYTPSTNANP